MYIKVLKKSIIFIIIFSLLMALLTVFFSNNQEDDGFFPISNFYAEEKNTIDVLLFGTSQMYCDVNSNVIWDETRITSYNLAKPEQPLWMTYYYMKEAFKYQKPKLAVLDVYAIKYDEEYKELWNNNVQLDSFKMSKNKLDAINASIPEKERAYFLIKLLKEKDNWKNINKSNFTPKFRYSRSDTKGHLEMYDVAKVVPYTGFSKKVKLLSEKNEVYFKKIIDLCKEENIPLLVVKTPHLQDNEIQEKYNRVEEITKENNIEFLNLNSISDEIGIDFNKDFSDWGIHLNISGSTKVTKYLAEYFKENYDLKNKNNLVDDDQWDEDVANWKEREKIFYLKNERNILDYFEQLDNPNLITIISYKHNNMGDESFDNELINNINSLGFNLDTEKLKNNNYFSILEDANINIEKYSDIEMSIEENISLDKDIPSKVQASFSKGKVSILLDENEISHNRDGILLFVYDKKSGEIVDNIVIDPENSETLLR